MSKVTFKIKSPDNLIKFLARFYPIDKDIILEITTNALVAKLSSTDKAIIKFSHMPLGDVLESANFSGDVRIPLYDQSKIAKALKHFAPGEEIFMDLSIRDYDGYKVTSEIVFHTDKLKIKIATGDIELFKFIPADTLNNIVKLAASEKIVEFPFAREIFEKAASLCNIDAATDHLGIDLQENGDLSLHGKSFDYKLDTIQTGHNIKFKMRNKFFAAIDPESSNFALGHNRLVIKSTESKTIVVIGNVNE